MNVFGGVQITLVEVGTEIGKDRDGNPMVVTDKNVVFNGPRAWVTQKIYDKLKGVGDE